MIKLVAFAPPVQPKQTMTIRVYCVDDYDSNSIDRRVCIAPFVSVFKHNSGDLPNGLGDLPNGPKPFKTTRGFRK